jgi:thymidylate kinase
MARWVILEGIDGAGKSTITHWLYERFKSILPAVWKVSETSNYDVSSDRIVSKLVRRASSEKDPFRSAILFSAARLFIPKSYPFHDNFENELVIFRDRCFLSTMAYQGARMAEELSKSSHSALRSARRLLFDFLKRCDDASFDPALLVLLRVDPEVSYRRQRDCFDIAEHKDWNKGKEIEFLGQVSENYVEFIREFQDFLPSWSFVYVDSNGDLSVVTHRVEKMVLEWLSLQGLVEKPK